MKRPESQGMLEEITGALKARTDISAWQVTELTSKGRQLFLIGRDVESIRSVGTVKYHVTVHLEKEDGSGGALGESTSVFLLGDDIDAKLDLAVAMAGGVSNKPWGLPGPDQKYMGAEIKDASIALGPEKLIGRIKDEVLHAVDGMDDVRLSSSEVFAEHRRFELVNSLGLSASAEDTGLLWDFVLMTGEGHEEVESSGYKNVRFYRDLKVGETLRRYAAYARESLAARAPENGRFDVVLSGEALDHLFDPFMAHAGGASAYQGWSTLEAGKPVVRDPEGELLTLFSNPQLPGGLKSGPFDGNGLATRQVEVIRDNIFRKRTLDKRYADYLGGEPTGGFANVEVATGAKPMDELITDGCYHLVRFSTFEPNPVTGDFSGEIRTGYLVRGGKSVPVKGGSVSGNIQDAFARAWFSSDKVTTSAYRGPKAVKLSGLDIAGE